MQKIILKVSGTLFKQLKVNNAHILYFDMFSDWPQVDLVRFGIVHVELEKT